MKKTVSALTSVATILSLSGAAFLAPIGTMAAVPADYGLTEGNTISASGTNDPDIYIVNAQGYKRLFLNPVIFNFYGHLGGFAKVKSVSAAARDAFPTSGLFRNCETSDQKVWAVEVTGEDTGTLHWVNMSGDAAVAQDSNFFKKVFCINNNEANWYTKSSVAYTSLSEVPVYSRTPGATPTPGSGLSASLAADNPASGTLVAGQALADLGHFSVSGSGAVTSVELKRLGVSGDTTLSNVYLFVNGVRVSDSGNVSSGKVTFTNGSGLFSAPATVVVKSDILAGTSGQTIGVQLSMLNGTAVSVSGNLFTIAATPGTFAAVAVGAATGPGNFDPQVDVNVWQSTFTVSSNEVYLKRLTVREIGSIDNKDVTNLRLFVDGVQISSTPGLNSDGYATFLANTRMLTGGRLVKVVADVVGGSSRTMQFQLKGAYDLEVMDEDYNVGAVPTGTFPNSATASTVGSASVTIIKATDSPAGDLVDDSNDQVLGRFTMTAFGEAVKVETFAFRASTSDSTIASLRNGRVLINGTQYGSTATLLASSSNALASTSFTVNYTLQPGVPVTVEVRADLHEATGTDSVSANDIVSVIFDNQATNGQGVTSATSIAVPGTDQESNNQTVKSGSMTLAKYSAYANQAVVLPNTLKLGQFVLTGGSAEDVNINTVNIGFAETGAWVVGDLSNVYLKVTNSTGGLVLQTSPKATVSSSASSSYSVNFTLPKNTSYQVEIWAASSARSSGTMTTSMDVAGTSAQSSATVTASTVFGQTLTASTGSISSAVGSGMPTAKIVAANTTASPVSSFDFTATNDNFTIYEAVFDIDTGTVGAAAVSSVRLMDGGTLVASAPLNGSSVSFTGMNISVPNGSTKALTVDLVLGNVGVNAASTAANVALNLESFKARDSIGNITSSTTERAGNAVYVHKSYPSVSAVALPSSVLTAGEVVLSKFNLTANTNTVGIIQVLFNLSKDTTTALASATASAKLYIDGSDQTSLGYFLSTGIGAGQSAGTITFIFNSEYQISGGVSKVFELRDTVSAIGATGSIVTQLLVGNSTVANPNASSTFSTAKLVWTDRSASSHSESTADWFNDYLIKNSTSQALVK